MYVEEKNLIDYTSGGGCVPLSERRLFVGTAIILAKSLIIKL